MKSVAIIIFLAFTAALCPAQEKRGAAIPWITSEAERMRTTGIVLAPGYDPYHVETESSGQQCVKLETKGQFIEFTPTISAKTIVIRFSLPDNGNGDGTRSTLGIYENGKLIRRQMISSRYAWLYGKYPFTNDPAAGKPRHFYDELRLTGLHIGRGDVIRIQRDDSMDDDAGYCIIDLVDLENPAPPLKAPANSLSIADKRFLGDRFTGDYTEAFNDCIATAVETGKIVWIPAGTFKITGDIRLPAKVTVQGAGMWYSQLVGDDSLYSNPNRRVRLKGEGSNIHLADFAIIGKLNYRNDTESNDGIVGSFGTNSTISRIWIEHTKVGMWIQNSMNLKITGCRLRNTIADGINFCVGMAHSTIENCTARGTGDDCFAIWPTVSREIRQEFPPGHNLIIHCSGSLPYLANGAAIYGGDSNEVRECSFTDISQGSAILISTSFPTESKDKSIDNNFSGITLIKACDIKTSGGFDHDWEWRAAIEICLDKRNIAGIEITDVNIENSLSNGLSIRTKNEVGKMSILSNAILQNVTISTTGIGAKGKHGLFISGDAQGTLIIKKSNILDIQNESQNFNVTR